MFQSRREKGNANSQRQIVILDLLLIKMGTLGDLDRIVS